MHNTGGYMQLGTAQILLLYVADTLRLHAQHVAVALRLHAQHRWVHAAGRPGPPS